MWWVLLSFDDPARPHSTVPHVPILTRAGIRADLQDAVSGKSSHQLDMDEGQALRKHGHEELVEVVPWYDPPGRYCGCSPSICLGPVLSDFMTDSG